MKRVDHFWSALRWFLKPVNVLENVSGLQPSSDQGWPGGSQAFCLR